MIAPILTLVLVALAGALCWAAARLLDRAGRRIEPLEPRRWAELSAQLRSAGDEVAAAFERT